MQKAHANFPKNIANCVNRSQKKRGREKRNLADIYEKSLAIPRLDLTPGYWERTAQMRRSLLKKEKKARLGDCLIAQTCIDHEVPLIAVDRDFRRFARFGLKLA
jgi:predicted nucleic acid-binding protein